MTSDICARLAEPFDPAIVSWRVGPTNQDKSKGMALAYIDARDVMRRLDEVCGPENWQDEYPWSDGKRVVCRIGIKILVSELANPNRQYEWVWKGDGAGDTDTEGEKGALSDAFKRAAVKWGVGRYLYDTESPWVAIQPRGKSYFIPDNELARLATRLPRPGKPADARPAPPPPSHAGNGTAPPAATSGQQVPAADETKRRLAVEARGRIRTALEKAETPKLIDEIISINGRDLQVIKEVGPQAYENLMTLANGRKSEMFGATG